MAPTALAATVSSWEAVVDNWDIMCHRVINQINSPGGDRFARNECNILGMTETDPERTLYYALLLSSVWFGHDPRAAWTHTNRYERFAGGAVVLQLRMIEEL